MARKPRIEFPGALYHVINRGNKRENIFLNDGDMKQFLDKLSEYKKRYEFLLYAYVLMGNHLHLLIETKEVPLSKIMQGILQSFTQYHNKKYKTVGHLFQGRYKAILCDKEAYLLELVRYIHLNPARAEIVVDPLLYQWSSHRVYMGLEEGIVDKELVLNLFHASEKKAIVMYDEFIKDGIGKGTDELFNILNKQTILGGETFIEMLQSRREGIEIFRERKRDKAIQDIVKIVKGITGFKREELASKSRANQLIVARSLFVYLCKEYTKAGNREIGDFLNRDPTVVSYYMKQTEKKECQELITRVKHL